MCVILSCKPGVRPGEDVLRTCWNRNPDGAGFMWADGEKVNGRKGFMTLDDLLPALAEVPVDAPLIIHFRIGTSGGLDERVTHPYPVSSSLLALHSTEWQAEAGLAHNGVLHGQRVDNAKGVSDTVAYVRDVVAPLMARRHGNLTHSKTSKRVLKDTSLGSRLAVMSADGAVVLTGHGWNEVCPGVSASNTSWRAPRVPRRKAVDLGDLPLFCASCAAVGWCSKTGHVPQCEDVALMVGYSQREFDETYVDWSK